MNTQPNPKTPHDTPLQDPMLQPIDPKQLRPIHRYAGEDIAEDLGDLVGTICDLAKEGRSYASAYDYELAATVYRDAADLRDIYISVAKGAYRDAAKQMDDLDTAVRDCLPTRLYERLPR